MQLLNENLKKIALYLIFILIIVKFVFIPLYEQNNEKKQTLAKKIKNYELTLILKESSSKDVSDQLINRIYSSEESTALIQSSLLSFIEDYCKKNNITLLNYDIPDPLAEDKLTKINLVIQLEGKPSQIINFLETLRKYPKIIDISSFDATENQNKYEFTLVLSTYKITNDIK